MAKCRFNDFESFVAKFKNAKTTDDCYTPKPVYDAVLQYVVEKANLDDEAEIVRPFFPGGGVLISLVKG